jgi:hypothetical protein
MPKRRRSPRTYRTITFKVYDDTDAEIMRWWDGIEAGERSDILRDIIRAALGLELHPRRLNIPELLDVRRDTLWIRRALNDMPGYLEQIVQQAAALGGARPQSADTSSESPSAEAGARLNDDERQRRAQRIRKATW